MYRYMLFADIAARKEFSMRSVGAFPGTVQQNWPQLHGKITLKSQENLVLMSNARPVPLCLGIRL